MAPPPPSCGGRGSWSSTTYNVVLHTPGGRRGGLDAVDKVR